jgi:flagellar basal-body rod protein FlgC
MNLLDSMGVSASGLNAQRIVIHVIAMNLSNAHTTRTAEGGPYLRKQVVLSPSFLGKQFSALLSQKMGKESVGVKAEIIEDGRGVKIIYDPTHPDADETGLVALPNVQITEEMINLLRATRSYEANITSFNAAKQMALKSLEIGNKP